MSSAARKKSTQDQGEAICREEKVHAAHSFYEVLSGRINAAAFFSHPHYKKDRKALNQGTLKKAAKEAITYVEGTTA